MMATADRSWRCIIKDPFDAVYDQMREDFRSVMLGLAGQRDSLRGMGDRMDEMKNSLGGMKNALGGMKNALGGMKNWLGGMKNALGEVGEVIGRMESAVEGLQASSRSQEEAMARIGRRLKRFTRLARERFGTLETRVDGLEEREAG